MTKLNCQVGDLAIAVNVELPENQGCIVQVIADLGMMNWSTFGLVQMWEVEVVSQGRCLYYETDGVVDLFDIGPAPDRALKPLTPPKDEIVLLEKGLDLVE
jgi:hypothetical protein